MTKCVFCGTESSPYKGVSRINNDGSVSFFCSGKCRKNAIVLRRDKKKLKWTEAHRISQEKAAASEKRASDKEAEKKASESKPEEKKK